LSNKIYFEKFHSEEEFLYFWSLASNEKAMAMNYGRAFTMDEAMYLFNHMLMTNLKYKDFGYFKVFESSSNNFIGLGAVVVNDSCTEAEIEYMLLPDYWGNGYGSEIAAELLHRAYFEKDIQQAAAITSPNNAASKKILIKLGFLSQKVYEIEDGSLAELFIKKL
jgi:[ribosomal protein S5]-alanine N-acetyltransferase